jgi:hypothetical protein
MKRCLAVLGFLLLLAQPSASLAVPMTNDPKGFQDIAWGSALESRPDLEITYKSPQVVEYQFKGAEASFAGIPVKSLRLSAVGKQFARVTIRYQGETTHQKIMRYMEQRYGPLQRIPGQMMRGLNQQYTWRGTESEINLTYHASTERGFIFLESRTLAPRFNDQIGDSAE